MNNKPRFVPPSDLRNADPNDNIVLRPSNSEARHNNIRGNTRGARLILNNCDRTRRNARLLRTARHLRGDLGPTEAEAILAITATPNPPIVFIYEIYDFF